MGGHGTYYQLMIRKNEQVLYATHAQGGFMSAKQMAPIFLPHHFLTKETAERCWRNWANRHPAYAADCIHVVVEAEA